MTLRVIQLIFSLFICSLAYGQNYGSGPTTHSQGVTGLYMGELINQGYSQIMSQPSALNISGANNEVQGLTNYRGNLYIGYYSNNSAPRLNKSPVYVWNGKTESLFYELDTGASQNGTGSNFGGIKPIVQYQGNLYIGNQIGFSGGNLGSVFVYNPNLTPVNMLQFPSIPSTNETTNVSVPGAAANYITGSTAFSVEYYGRIDDLGGGGAATIVRNKNSAGTTGWNLSLTTSNAINASIVEGGVNKGTTTNTQVFKVGNNVDIIESWTSGSNPIIYVNGVAVGLASMTTVTTPSNDTGNTLWIGNNGLTNASSFSGTFRRLRIWNNYAVTSGDASSLASGGSAAQSPTAQYLFTDGTGTTVTDSSGNGNNGTIHGNANWNTNLFDAAYSSGVDQMIYAMAVFKGKLYAGAGFNASHIYVYDGNTWSTAYSGLANYNLVNNLYVYNGRLFAGLQGTSGANGGAIISTADGVNWTVEETVPFATAIGFTTFQEFRGNLYTMSFKGASGTNDVYRRYGNGTWIVEAPSINDLQCWSMNDYDNALYVGCTHGGGSQIFKSYDGVSFLLDYTIPNANNTETFAMANYNGSLYIGLGYTTATSAVIYRKTDSIGQQTDWLNTFLNHVRQNTSYTGMNWPNEDPSTIQVSGQWSYDNVARFIGGINWQDAGLLQSITSANVNWSDPSFSATPAIGQLLSYEGFNTNAQFASIGQGLNSNGTTLKSTAEQTISYQPGLLTSVNSNIGVYGKFVAASTVDNLTCSALTFTCVSNPTITEYECGTSATCATPTTIGTCTITASGTAVNGTINNSAITAGDYVGFAMTAGTCTSLDASAISQVHSN